MSQKPAHIVDAYAGAAYPERPRRVFWRDRWREIADVEHQERQPHRRCFVVRLQPIGERDDDDIKLRLCYDYANDAWSVEAL